jgi:hypothetical protein
MAADGSSAASFAKSVKATTGTSTWMSILSMRGPEILARQPWVRAAVHLHRCRGSVKTPHGCRYPIRLSPQPSANLNRTLFQRRIAK